MYQYMGNEVSPHGEDGHPSFKATHCFSCGLNKHHNLIGVLENEHGVETLYQCLSCGFVGQAFHARIEDPT